MITHDLRVMADAMDGRHNCRQTIFALETAITDHF